MNFTELTIKTEYRSPRDNVVEQFFLPVLECSISYKRSVGFFSSTALIKISKGITPLVKNGGKIELVASPYLSEEDKEAIRRGYDNRLKIIEKTLLKNLTEPDNTPFASERLNLLACLIENGVLDIKIAFTDDGNSVGMYHEKLGLLEDKEGNKIAFSGSMNESGVAMNQNYEIIDVFCDWKSEGEKARVVQKEEAFARIWGNCDSKLKVISFPAINKAILDKYKKGKPDYDIDRKESSSFVDYSHDNDDGITFVRQTQPVSEIQEMSPSFFDFHGTISPKPHQKEAIENFKENNFQTLFAMATGTGKTLTSLFAANELNLTVPLENILILVPLKDLVDQWEKDIRKYFSGTIILVRSGLDWKNHVSNFTLKRILNPDKKERLVVISTYDSFSLNKNKILDILTLSKTLIIADECHKTGAKTYRTNLPEEIKFRIGLSATPKRPFDEKGTKAIFDYFDPHENPFEFTIGQAIENGMLCPYNYYPILVELTVEEMESYAEISEKINKLVQIVNSTAVSEEDEEHLEQLLKQRHRIIERAENKYESFISIFLREIRKYQNYTIVFAPDGKDENNEDLLKKYQTEVTQLAYKNRMYITTIEYIQGTSKENLNFFATGQADVVFAKQRLNEGIDIPAARRAFFIASSTSERGFIQRRGRVLRLHPEKTVAEIFDFVVIPPQSTLNFYDPRLILQIKESELKRALDFAKTANNFLEIAKVLHKFLGIEG